MKKLLLLIAIVVLAIAGWFGYGQYHQYQLLASGKNVLLINKTDGVYSFTDLMNREDITSNFKPVAYADQLSADEIANITVGLTLVGTKNQPTEQVLAVKVPVPTDIQKKDWQSASKIITQAQLDLCGQMGRADIVQACTFRHYIFDLLNQGGTESQCDAIYVSNFVTECKNFFHTDQRGSLVDSDHNNRIDLYEYYANPAAYDSQS